MPDHRDAEDKRHLFPSVQEGRDIRENTSGVASHSIIGNLEMYPDPRSEEISLTQSGRHTLLPSILNFLCSYKHSGFI